MPTKKPVHRGAKRRVLEHAIRSHKQGEHWLDTNSTARELNLPVKTVGGALSSLKAEGEIERRVPQSTYYRYLPAPPKPEPTIDVDLSDERRLGSVIARLDYLTALVENLPLHVRAEVRAEVHDLLG